jgi:hypothetical protein
MIAKSHSLDRSENLHIFCHCISRLTIVKLININFITFEAEVTYEKASSLLNVVSNLDAKRFEKWANVTEVKSYYLPCLNSKFFYVILNLSLTRGHSRTHWLDPAM